MSELKLDTPAKPQQEATGVSLWVFFGALGNWHPVRVPKQGTGCNWFRPMIFYNVCQFWSAFPCNPFGHNSGSRRLFQSWLPQRFWTLQTARAFKMVLIHSQLSRVKVDRAQIEHVQYILNKVRLSQWSLHILIRYNFVAKVLDCHKSPPRIVRAMHRHNFAFQKVETCGLFQKLAPYELSSAGLLNGGQFFFCQKRKTMPI